MFVMRLTFIENTCIWDLIIHLFMSTLTTCSENKSQQLRKVFASAASNGLTALAMQQSRMKSHRIGHQSNKRKPI